MKLLLYSDPHWSETSSIIRERGDKYSLRLENLIRSINWAESMAYAKHCDAIVMLGDFFDKPTLTAEEITALTEIEWADMPHYFIVGNHDANTSNLCYASTFVLNKDNFKVVNEPTFIEEPVDVSSSLDIVYLLPYITESDRKPLSEYLSELGKSTCVDTSSNQIILSHNDMAGINYGKFTSNSGFSVDEILSNCDLYINGHLHNAGFVDDKEKILNIGNLTGQNFSEDAFIHRHYCAVLNTANLELEFFENPYAFNFYKVEITSRNQISMLSDLGPNAVVSIKCLPTLVDELKNSLVGMDNISIYRLTTIVDSTKTSEVEISELTSVNYLTQFYEYMHSIMDNTDILEEELQHVIKV